MSLLRASLSGLRSAPTTPYPLTPGFRPVDGIIEADTDELFLSVLGYTRAETAILTWPDGPDTPPIVISPKAPPEEAVAIALVGAFDQPDNTYRFLLGWHSSLTGESFVTMCVAHRSGGTCDSKGSATFRGTGLLLFGSPEKPLLLATDGSGLTLTTVTQTTPMTLLQPGRQHIELGDLADGLGSIIPRRVAGGSAVALTSELLLVALDVETTDGSSYTALGEVLVGQPSSFRRLTTVHRDPRQSEVAFLLSTAPRPELGFSVLLYEIDRRKGEVALYPVLPGYSSILGRPVIADNAKTLRLGRPIEVLTLPSCPRPRDLLARQRQTLTAMVRCRDGGISVVALSSVVRSDPTRLGALGQHLASNQPRLLLGEQSTVGLSDDGILLDDTFGVQHFTSERDGPVLVTLADPAITPNGRTYSISAISDIVSLSHDGWEEPVKGYVPISSDVSRYARENWIGQFPFSPRAGPGWIAYVGPTRDVSMVKPVENRYDGEGFCASGKFAAVVEASRERLAVDFMSAELPHRRSASVTFERSGISPPLECAILSRTKILMVDEAYNTYILDLEDATISQGRGGFLDTRCQRLIGLHSDPTTTHTAVVVYANYCQDSPALIAERRSADGRREGSTVLRLTLDESERSEVTWARCSMIVVTDSDLLRVDLRRSHDCNER